MGWTWQHLGKGQLASELRSLLTGENEYRSYRPLDLAIVERKVAYAAVEVTMKTEEGKAKADPAYPDCPGRYVYGMVFLLEWAPKDHYNFGYKDMDESMGPYVNSCPARILKLLSPTTDENALRWRADCRRVLAARVTVRQLLQEGERVQFANPVTFGRGLAPQSRFLVSKVKPLTLYALDGNFHCRIRRQTLLDAAARGELSRF